MFKWEDIIWNNEDFDEDFDWDRFYELAPEGWSWDDVTTVQDLAVVFEVPLNPEDDDYEKQSFNRFWRRVDVDPEDPYALQSNEPRVSPTVQSFLGLEENYEWSDVILESVNYIAGRMYSNGK